MISRDMAHRPQKNSTLHSCAFLRPSLFSSNLCNPRHLRLLLLLLAVAVAPGCEGVAFLAAMGGQKIKKIHQLQDTRTVVLVDDPNDLLGDPGLKGVVASNVRYFIMQGKGGPKEIIDPQEVTMLATRMGTSFERTPVDRIGRELEANQVIYVFIESAQLSSGPGLMRPVAGVQVKVIDAQSGQRLFPATYVPKRQGAAHKDVGSDTFSPEVKPVPNPGTSGDPRGYRFGVKLDPAPADSPKRGDPYMLQRHLAEEIGKQVAWVFVDHPAPEPGDNIAKAQQRY